MGEKTKGAPKSKPQMPNASPEEVPVPPVEGSREAYDRHLTEALALDARDVVPFKADAVLAYHNINQAVKAVMPREAQVRKELPTVKIEDLSGLTDLALAVVYAAHQVDRSVGSTGTIAELLAEARRLRGVLLTSAAAVAAKGLVPLSEVERIQKGVGPIDTGNDCLELVALFQKYPAALAKTPVMSEDLSRAAEVGKELLAVLTPTAARGRKEPAPELVEAVNARDRLWTLLVRGHDLLKRVGCWLFGHAASDAEVPALQSRLVAPRKKPAEPKTEAAGGAAGAPRTA